MANCGSSEYGIVHHGEYGELPAAGAMGSFCINEYGIFLPPETVRDIAFFKGIFHIWEYKKT